MTAEMVARTIQLILAPVVMVSACGLVLNGVLARYAAVNDRLRALSRERLDLLRAQGGVIAGADALTVERLSEIDAQVPHLLRHHKRLHDAVLAVYCAILVFVASMFVIAVAAMGTAAWLASAALVTFLAGTGVLLLGVLLTALEVRTSHVAVHFEVKRVMELGQ